MRKIKFRAWDKKKKKMHPVSELIWNPELEQVAVQTGKEAGYVSVSTDFILMQYTGMKGSKGVEIYEGDILNYGDNFNSVVYYDAKYDFAFRIRELGVIKGELRARTHELMAYTYRPTILGSIYENPELGQVRETMTYKIKVIKTNEDYQEALALVEEIMSKNPESESEDGEKLSLLVTLIQDYETKMFPESLPDPRTSS